MDERTLNFYNNNSKEFYKSIINANLNKVYNKFLKYVKGNKILDLGCGVGRDLIYFKEKGYDVEGLDASIELVKIAEEISKVKVHFMKYEDMTFLEKYDGIWGMAALVHQNKKEMKNTLNKIYKALKPKGIAYLSLKYGNFQGYDGERFFTYIVEEDLNEIIDKNKFLIKEIFFTNDDRGTKWMNIVLEKVK